MSFLICDLTLRRIHVCCLVCLFPILAGAQTISSPSFGELAEKAASARQLGDVSSAVELYRQAVQLKPDWPDGWWYLGVLQYSAGEYAQARGFLSRYIELTPDAGPALGMRGLCEFETGEYDSALTDIKRGLALGAANNPRNGKILQYHEALLLTRAASFEEALHILSELNRDGDSNAELPTAVGLAGLRVAQFPKDVEAEQKELFRQAGTAALYLMTGDEVRGREEFQKLFHDFPGSPNAHYLLGYLLFSSHPEEALTEFRRELEKSPSNGPANLMLAWAALMENDPAAALPFAEKAAQSESRQSGVQLVLGRALAGTGELRSGIEHLEKALQSDPENLEVHLALATAYAQTGRKQDARRERLLCLQITEKPGPVSESHP